MSTPPDARLWIEETREPDGSSPSRAAREGDASARGEGALGRDPFDDPSDFDPFIEGLAALRRASTAAPRLPPPAEVDDWLTRMLNEEDLRRLQMLDQLLDGQVGYDRYGFSPDAARRSFPVFAALYRHYFRVRSSGHEHVPRRGPVILAANRAGLLPFDAAMLAVDTFMHSDPPRLLRTLTSRWVGTMPWLNVLTARVGQVVATRENVDDLLADGQALLVFPEGQRGATKPISQRYQLQRFEVDLVQHALRARTQIVPVAVIGSDDQSPILFDFKGLARLLGLPAVPVTPTFPLLGPLGLVPYPVRYRIVYGEPLDFGALGPEAAHDSKIVRDLSRRVRRAVQQLMDRNR